MAHHTTSAAPSPPDLRIPPSSSVVDVSIINTTARITGIPTAMFFGPPIEGHQELAVPCFAFLVQHRDSGRTLLFDLGIRKDWQNLSPLIGSTLKAFGWKITVDRGVREILDDAGGIDTAAIEAVVWSHHHFDHIGDMATFEPATALIVGPGFKDKLLPGYPGDPDSPFLETDYSGRDLVELDFAQGDSGNTTKWKTLTIGHFAAIDYFGDGSFYLLDAPGHTVGHLCGLARVTGNGDSAGNSRSSFILMAGDAYHHIGEIRPSQYLPLPRDISPSPFTPHTPGSTCPGDLFAALLPHGRERPFYETTSDPEKSFHYSLDDLTRTIEKLQEADAHDTIFLAAAHDESLLDVAAFFPASTANGFLKQGWVHKARWIFLRDFAKAVGRESKTRL
ncbi:beta-lactamase-like protein [Lasiosphaeria miniovina]|uniref:Beta-lactamase-like protein n=1 Tax=Lasiosphaeria miniovina TaxID=1954250 RepID=A0AA40A6X6_9PEZI|nr:beta-lactamase-like protein [Lasiosphaeria miniovina]KAK0710278.1 beta-lactamase-like protein [Lasiosphaeria miniovina]